MDTSLPATEAVAQPGGISRQLAAYSRHVRAAVITSLLAVSAGAGLSPIAIEAGEDGTERIEGSAAEHAPMQPWLMPDGTLSTDLKGQTQSGKLVRLYYYEPTALHLGRRALDCAVGVAFARNYSIAESTCSAGDPEPTHAGGFTASARRAAAAGLSAAARCAAAAGRAVAARRAVVCGFVGSLYCL